MELLGKGKECTDRYILQSQTNDPLPKKNTYGIRKFFKDVQETCITHVSSKSKVATSALSRKWKSSLLNKIDSSENKYNKSEHNKRQSTEEYQED